MTNVKVMVPSFGKMVANISANGRLASSMESALISAKRVSRSKVNGKTDERSSGLVNRIVPLSHSVTERLLTMVPTNNSEIFVVRIPFFA